MKVVVVHPDDDSVVLFHGDQADYPLAGFAVETQVQMANGTFATLRRPALTTLVAEDQMPPAPTAPHGL